MSAAGKSQKGIMPNLIVIGAMNSAVLRDWWDRHRTKLLSAAIVFMALVALARLSIEFYRLLWEPGQSGAIDLRLRHQEVHLWFGGHTIYAKVGHAVYPPASYAILWPFLGWLSLTPARWLWAATSVAMLGWLAALLVQEGGAKTRLERVFLVLLLLSMYATNVTIGNGQLIVHILPALITGLTLLHRERGWWRELRGTMLIVATLVSPTTAAPFFWIVLFVPGRIRPAFLVVLGYVILTLVAAWFQEASPVSLIQDWLQKSQAGAAWGASTGGYANLHSWLAACGLEAWNQPASLLVLSALGIWVYYHCRVDLWLLLGVSAIVARIWVYHRLYDDLLLLLPMMTLFRIAKRSAVTDGSVIVAGGLLAALWVAMLAPARLLTALPPWGWLILTGQLVVWFCLLLFLLYQAWHEENAPIAVSH